MSGIFQPEKRILTEEQFFHKVNGTQLSYAEMQALRKSCGLSYDHEFLSVEIIIEKISATSWRKILSPAVALRSVPPL